MKTVSEDRDIKSSSRSRTTVRVLLSVFVAICAALSGITFAQNVPVPQGFLPSAAGMQPIDTLDNYSTTNPSANVVLATQPMNLSIGLPLRNQDALSNLLQQLYDPACTNYQQYLTPDQFTAMFGPTPDDYQAAINFVQTNGLTVTGTYSNRMLLDVSGTVAQVENAFGVTMLVYQHPTESRTFFAPNAEPSVPQTVPILDISGMNNYDIPRPNIGTAPDASGGYFAKDFRAAYAPDISLSLTGSGQNVALVEFDGFFNNDIYYYVYYAYLDGLTIDTHIQPVSVDGYNGAAGANNSEVALDIDMAMVMAPDLASIIVYEAPINNSASGNDILNKIANDNSAKQISCSWNGFPKLQSTEQIFREFAAQGQSYFNISSDHDAYTGTLNIYPADSPNVISVGGTTLSTTSPGGPWQSETVWNKRTPNPAGGNWGSTGGISTDYTIPSWQHGVSMANNQGSTTMRNFPDVALTADNVFIFYNNYDPNNRTGNYGNDSGTSCAAPLWAGFMALVNQQATANNHSSVGFINPAIYYIGKRSGYAASFHDITTGDNTWSGSPIKYYAVAGYDLCTGWGTPKGQSLIAALAGPSAPQDLNATAGNARVDLNWNASIGAMRYNVKRSTASGQETFLASTTGTTYTDTAVGIGVAYYYVVSAVNSAVNDSGVESANSSEVSATPASSSAPTIWTVAGNYYLGGTYSGDGSYAYTAGLSFPVGIAVDGSGNLYIADSCNNAIREVNNGLISTVAANYTPGATPPSQVDPNRYLEDISALNFPNGVAVDGSGIIYIADTGNNWISVDVPDYYLFGLVGCYGWWTGEMGDGGPAIDASLNVPGSVAVDGSGNIYIGDGLNNVIRKVDVYGTITTVAGNGTWGYSGNGGPAVNASLALSSGGYGVSAGGIAVDGSGDIYFADVGNHAVRKVDTFGNISTVAGGIGAGYLGDGGPATSAKLYAPAAVALNPQGNLLYIADTWNNVIRKVDLASGIISTVAGNQSLGGGYSGDQGLATSATLNHPLGVAVDNLGNLYISDSGNNVIRMVSF